MKVEATGCNRGAADVWIDVNFICLMFTNEDVMGIRGNTGWWWGEKTKAASKYFS